MAKSSTKAERISLAKTKYPTISPDLIEAQINSYELFVQEGIEELFDEINPIVDYTGEAWELSFDEVEWGAPNHTFRRSMELGLSYDRPLYVHANLVNKKTGVVKKQRLFIADIPLMSERGTFVVSGNERVVVMQIARAEGILFYETKTSTPLKRLYGVKLMPTRGRWFDFEVNKYGVMSVKLLEKRPKILLTTLLKALGYSNNQLEELLSGFQTEEAKLFEATLKRDTAKNKEEALLDIYRKLRPEDSISIEAAENFLNSLFFDKRRFYLGRIGRYQLNKKLGVTDKPVEPKNYVLYKEDLVSLIQSLMKLNTGELKDDDIDNLANRRIRGVGELISDQMRIGVLRMEKNIRDRMGTYGTDELITPSVLVNTRPIIAAVNQFFGSSQVSRYMDQENVLSEIETKRRITAGGPRGLTKERATFSVRDVHASSYSRLCPVTTPEGPSIGIVSHMSMYARINSYGFLEAPYYRVISNIKPEQLENLDILVGHTLREDVKNKEGKVVFKKGAKITKADIKKIDDSIEIMNFEPKISEEVVYLTPDEESQYKITNAINRGEGNEIEADAVFVRNEGSYKKVPINEIDFIDINPGQIAGLGFSLVPFAMHDDPTRTLMASNMQRQAVPLLKPQSPLAGTGFEKVVAEASKRCVKAADDGEVIESDAKRIKVKYKTQGEAEYIADVFNRTNQNTTFTQKVVAVKGQKIKKGDLLIDGPSMQNGELALGRNLMAAYMIYEGYNYEDAIIVSERLVKDDVLTSIHIKEYSQEVRDTKLGKELVTADIPNVGEYLLRNLDEDGIVRVGASVESKDILVGIVAPKGEVELTAEEKLLRAIFGEYARDVRDNSLRLPHGDSGIVIGVQVLDKEKGDKLNPGVLKQVKVWVARTKKISVGDKLTGIHGDKGVISKVLPEEDMPYMEDGTPIDIILSPMFVKRMNVGQIKEMHVAAQAKKLGIKVEVPPFTPIDDQMLPKMLEEKGIDWSEKIDLYDGRTGQKFDNKVTVGPRYIVKLNHLSSDKIHARSTGPYTVVTQQPLGGKAQFGGQRFGEMEVWALEAHAVPNVLQEMLTIKSDDVVGRAAAYKSIIQGQPIDPPSTPESFKVFVSELRALGINLEQVEGSGLGGGKQDDSASDDNTDSDDVVNEETGEVVTDPTNSTIIGDENAEMMTKATTNEIENNPNFEIADSEEEL